MLQDCGFEIIDIHQHMGSTADALGLIREGHVSGAEVEPEEVACRLEFMDRAGISKAVAIPGHTYNQAPGIQATREQNDAIARYRDLNPERFPVAAGIVEPNHQAAALDELTRMATELGLKGVSFHTEYQSCTIDSPWMMRILERMAELGLTPMIHASNVVLHEALWRMAKVARAFPEIPFVALEPGFTFDGMQECAFIAEVATNVVFDTAACASNPLIIELARRFGAERVIYGTQYYSRVGAFDERAFARRILMRDDLIATPHLTGADKQMIFSGNARRLFGI
jgi:predicted TIM-barrel fold metal-dependent hydrolase